MNSTARFPLFTKALRQLSGVGRRGEWSQARQHANKARLRLETLEDRAMPSVLPTPIVTGQTDISNFKALPNPLPPGAPPANAPEFWDEVSPSVTVDPINSQKLFSTYLIDITRDPTPALAPVPQKIYIAFSYSTNGGQTWKSSFSDLGMGLESNDLDPTTLLNNPPIPYIQTSNATAAFDRNENVYLVYSEHNNGSASGEIVLRKFNFASGTPLEENVSPSQIYNTLFGGVDQQVLYRWVGNDPVFNPVVAVDTNLSTYTDPVTNAVQNDPFSGNVYVAWNSNYTPPTPVPPTFNPNSVKLLASSDGGLDFSSDVYLNRNENFITTDGGGSVQPQLTISQGQASGPVPGGLVSVAWSNNASGELRTYTGGIAGAASKFAVGPTGFIADATPGQATALTPVTTTIADLPPGGDDIGPVNLQLPPAQQGAFLKLKPINQPQFTQLTKITVQLDMTYFNDDAIVVSLISPDTDVNGNPITPIEVNLYNTDAPSHTAMMLEGFAGTTFDDAGAPLSVGTPPYTGTFQPHSFVVNVPGTGLAAFNGINPNGVWTLHVRPLDQNPINHAKFKDITLNITATPTLSTQTKFTQFVDLGSVPNFTSISDLDVVLGMTHPDFQQLKVELLAPNGQTVTLFENRFDTSGTARLGNPGITGSHIGSINGAYIGTTFDDAAPRSIKDMGVADPFVGHFKPESSLGLRLFDDLNKVSGTGNWSLIITDNVAGPAASQTLAFVSFWGLRFTSGLPSTPTNNLIVSGSVFGSAAVTGNFQGIYPLKAAVSPDKGIGPNVVLASDNTLGSFSPYQGRLYMAWVSASTTLNRADDTNIWLAHSDDGGNTWIARVNPVNDDVLNGFPNDNFSEGRRPQFQPSIAVDPYTGTLVVSWLDGRWDAARTRVTTYVAISNDGGQTFSQTYVNATETATDAITGKVNTIEPIPDSQAANNPARDVLFNFGDFQGLAVAAGHIYPVWASNRNGAQDYNTSSFRTLDIWTANVTYAAGPRILSSTMGPILDAPGPDQTVTLLSDGVTKVTYNNTRTADGTPQVNGFTVSFDRPVDPATFDPSDVTVIYRNTTTPPSQPGTPVAVAGVTAVFDPNNPQGLTLAQQQQFGASRFLVTFTTPQSGTGTYSYTVGPNIRDRIRSIGFGILPGPTNLYNSGQVNKPIPPDQNTGDTGGPNSPATTSTIVVSGVPNNQIINHLSVTVNVNHTFDADLVFTLIAPDGTQVLLSKQEGFNGQNYTLTTFDDTALLAISQGTAPFTGTFRPESPLSILNGKDSNGTWTLQIQDVNAQDVGTLQNWSLTIQTGTRIQTADVLGNFMDQNTNAVTAESPGDVWAVPRPVNGVPFTAPYNSDTLPIIVPGPHVFGTSVPGQAPTTDNLVLNSSNSAIDVVFDRNMQPGSFTPAQVLRLIGPTGVINGPFTVTPNPLGTDPDPNFPRTYRIGFPAQTVSGTYSLILAPTIKAKNGDQLDSSRNAGLDNLRTMNSSANTTTSVVFSSSNVPVTLFPGKTETSTLTITDNFDIEGLTLKLNITHPNDPDLTADLVAPDGTIIRLFTQVGGAGTRANFTNTVFDDSATVPIQLGTSPFNGSFNPQQPLSVLLHKAVTGTYKLVITNSSPQNSGTLTSWSLTFQKAVAGTGLGEAVADQATVHFRIFTLDVNNPLSHNSWTAVGPASINNGANAGRIGGIAVDPSDPSGNTVYVAAATGGVWKTTNFMTVDPSGPTYVPLTDFGPSQGINIGGLAVFGRNNSTNQSIVFAATGDGDSQPNADFSGVGFLRSFDGGATWTLLDSSTNVDAGGNELPISSPLRDHIFVGASAFKILVDPTASPSGDVIVYAALSGTHGGIWRSMDSGKHWQNMRAGQATDLLFAPDSATQPTNNLQLLFAGFRGEGVFETPNQGATWIQLVGGVGDPLIQDRDQGNPAPSIPVVAPPDTPNGVKGRIALATPFLTGNINRDKQYEGWVYAAVANADGTLNGLYSTKDFGQNWTRVRLPFTPLEFQSVAFPTNDELRPDYNPLSGVGNYALSLTVDPTNPNTVYLSGTPTGRKLPALGLIRVDTSVTADPHALFPYDNDANDGGLALPQTVGGFLLKDSKPVVTLQTTPEWGLVSNPRTGYVNLLRDPANPFLSNASILVQNVAQFNNDGGETTFAPFNDILQTTYQPHRVVVIRDPLTGHARLIYGDESGVFTGVDDGNGTLLNSVGTAPVITGSRNGNLQITPLFYGASQPSLLAGQIAGALLYGNSAGNGTPHSDPNILSNGNLNWTVPFDAPQPGNPFLLPGPLLNTVGGGIASDQTGSGTSYHFVFPDSNVFHDANLQNPDVSGYTQTDFFQVTPPSSVGIGRTFGLLQQPGLLDAQWPSSIVPPSTGGVINFTVNPLSGNQIVISSGAGRIFRTEDQGETWFSIGEPTDLDSSKALALTFGAPEPGASGSLDNFIYAGTENGHIFVTFTGGGNGATNAWIPLSAGLDGSEVKAIVTNPTRGSHEAYAVTRAGVYRMLDSSVPGATWQKLTGSLFQLTHNPFGNTNLTETTLKSLASIAADWRFSAVDNPALPNSPTHPVLYVGGLGGVFRSSDLGVTWTPFPSIADGSPADGGYLPNVLVTDLDIVLGNINTTSGLPDQSTGPDILLASTFGRGAFAIRLPSNVSSGPRVIGFSPASTMDSVTVTFNKAVDLSTFSVSDITTFVGPNGPITATSITDVITDPQNAQAHKVFKIGFAPQSQSGRYTLTFGPDVRDFSGDEMDQNGNGINGEGADSFTGHFVIAPHGSPPMLVTGADAPGGPEVKVLNAQNLAVIFDFNAYNPAFTGGVRVAMGDVNNDGVPDIITAPGKGGGPDIRVFDGLTGTLIREFFAYNIAFTGGVSVASADVNGDGFADIITGAGPGGGPHVEVFSGKDGSLLMSFFPYNVNFTGGVNVAAGDTNGDGHADVITGAGPGGGPHVEVFSGANGMLLQSFFAYNITFTGGVFVSAADVNGDGKADILTGAGQGGGPHVEAFSGVDKSLLLSFFAYDKSFAGGVRVGGVSDLNGDGHDDILTSAGPTGGPHVKAFDSDTLTALDSFFAYNPAFAGGVYVGGY